MLLVKGLINVPYLYLFKNQRYIRMLMETQPTNLQQLETVCSIEVLLLLGHDLLKVLSFVVLIAYL